MLAIKKNYSCSFKYYICHDELNLIIQIVIIESIERRGFMKDTAIYFYLKKTQWINTCKYFLDFDILIKIVDNFF